MYIEVKDSTAFVKDLIDVFKANAQDDCYLTKREAAAILSVHANSIDALCRRGALKRYKNGHVVRYKRSEVMRCLEVE